MSRITVVLAVFVLLVLAQAGQAADLQAGWYANIWLVDIYVDDSHGVPQLLGDAYFYSTPPGDYWPFQVTDGPYHQQTTRYVSVPENTGGVQTDQSLMMPLTLGLSQGSRIAYLHIACETSYDSSIMNLQVWYRDNSGNLSKIWSQPIGGQTYCVDDFAYDTVLDGSYFVKVAIVPEPSSILTLTAAAIFSALSCWRRKR